MSQTWQNLSESTPRTHYGMVAAIDGALIN